MKIEGLIKGKRIVGHHCLINPSVVNQRKVIAENPHPTNTKKLNQSSNFPDREKTKINSKSNLKRIRRELQAN